MSFIEILKAVLFGIVEGITEWLPVSSTGHMILLDELVKMNVSEEFWSMFLVVIQLGAILAVVVLYWNRLFPFNIGKKPVIRTDIFQMWFKIIAACIPAGIVGILFSVCCLLSLKMSIMENGQRSIPSQKSAGEPPCGSVCFS